MNRAKKQMQYIEIWMKLNPKLTVGEAGRRLQKMRARGYRC